MKKIGVIPARYGSTRFEGKPLADICGKPMVWWVYNQAQQANLDIIYVATDDERIYSECEKRNLNVLMTSKEHSTPNDRVHEVSTKVEGDIFVCINGDEPLIEASVINASLPYNDENIEMFYSNVITTIHNPVEVVDPTNIKVIANDKNEALWASRNPIPFPKGSMQFDYKKIVGVAAFSRDALQYYVNTPKSNIEKAEELDLYRFLYNHKIVKLHEIQCNTLSVDTPKDLEQVRQIIKKRLHM